MPCNATQTGREGGAPEADTELYHVRLCRKGSRGDNHRRRAQRVSSWRREANCVRSCKLRGERTEIRNAALMSRIVDQCYFRNEKTCIIQRGEGAR